MGEKKMNQNGNNQEVEKVEDICQDENPEGREQGEEKEREVCPNAGTADEFQTENETQNGQFEESDSKSDEGEKSLEVLALEEEKKSLIDRLSRLQADFDNYRRRSLQEKEELINRANENLLLKFLPIMDNFERALEAGNNNEESFFKGVAMIYRQLLNLLEKEGVKPFDPMGETFDHNKHHAVMKEPAPDDVEEDTIIQVLQKGYFYKENVLRPAMVKVAE